MGGIEEVKKTWNVFIVSTITIPEDRLILTLGGM